MQILCPICSTSIDITEAHLGQKARCLGCQSKFIIPVTVGGEFEILERGPNAPSPPAEAAPQRSRATAPATSASSGSKPAIATPAAGGNAAARSIAARSLAKKKGGSAGFLITCLLVAGGLGYGWFKLSEKSEEVADAEPPADDAFKGENSAEPKTKEPAPAAAVQVPETPPPTEPEPEVVAEEPAAPEEPMMAAGDLDDDAPFASGILGEAPPQLTEDKKTRALAYLKSDQSNKRKGAYTALRNLGDAAKPSYAALLKEARTFHLDALGNKAFDLSVGDNALSGFEDAHDEWKAAAAAALTMVQTNWKADDPKGYKAKQAEMDRMVGDVEKLYEKLPKAIASTGGKDLETLQAGADVLAEMGAELAWAEGENADAKPLRELLKEAGGADDFVEVLDLLTTARGARQAADAVAQHNETINWGTSTYKAFATIVNNRRAALGLEGLRLDQNLSTACEAHSGDMLFLDYFSHTGADGSSFGARAKRANFGGAPTGECIFKGSPSATAAHKAWWYSDGHRTIMYATGSNTLGLGTASELWTLNTGKKRW